MVWWESITWSHVDYRWCGGRVSRGLIWIIGGVVGEYHVVSCGL